MNGGWEGGFVPPQGKEDASIIEAVNNGGRGEAAGRGGGVVGTDKCAAEK